MKNLFIPFELAIIARQKGFNETCFGWYSSDGCFYTGEITINQGLLLAPLYQQIIDWFKFEKGIHFKLGLNVIIVKSQFPDIIIDGRIIEKENYYNTLNKALEEAFKLI